MDNLNKENIQKAKIPNYKKSASTIFDHIVAFFIGFLIGGLVLYVFYKITIISLIGGAIFGAINIFVAIRKAKVKRLILLRTQFFDLLESMAVSMRSGSPVLRALENAREDLKIIYSVNSDIIKEVNIIILKFNNAIQLSDAFYDFANRSGLEDVYSFATVFATIEGKSSRAHEIVAQTQEIIADKIEIEMEIDTLMTGAKSEANIMLFMPLVVLVVINNSGGGFLDNLYNTPIGRIVATGGLIVFIFSYYLTAKFSNIEV